MAKAKKDKSKAAKPRRRKGTGSIIIRNGKYELRWREKGKLHQETTGLSATKANRKAAEDMLAKKTMIERYLTRKQQIDLLMKEKESLEEKIARLEDKAKPKIYLGGLVEAFRESPWKRCKPKQLEIYLQQLGAFVKWAKKDEMDFGDVDDAMVEKYAKYLDHFAAGTYNKHLNCLTLVWRAVGRSAGVRVNPWADLPRKDKDSHRRRDLEQEEIELILAATKGELRDLINIGLHTGMRLGDCCLLQWEAFKADGTVVVKTQKTGQEIRLSSANLLAALGRTGSTGDVLPDTAELYRRDPAAVSKQITRAFERAGITTTAKEKGWGKARSHASFHSLRHTFASRLINSGVPIAMVRELVGHSSEKMTEHYSHVSADAVLAALQKAGL